MVVTYMKCESYKDLQTLMLKQLPKPKSSNEKEQYQKEWLESTKKAKVALGRIA